ncbi:hypothetical protein QAD02_001575 [Eretmocerus hayati]|uniref:Uncharacterized protein n=1 Tax=Eretmocerus hayati TaxID=131215 RepID=A0ACC2NI65_9HYME|nr:hypothetical protein QAD02_001575 [Eretmocerus hayati]
MVEKIEPQDATSPSILQQHFLAKSDVWSLACVIDEVFQRKLTWTLSPQNDDLEDDRDEMENKFKNGDLPDLSGLPEEIRKPFSKCFFYENKTAEGTSLVPFRNDPTKRSDMEELLENLPQWL